MAPHTNAPINADALVIGAGPVGLFQVFQLGLLELHAEVIDALPYPGGQCVALYGDKPIYDIPAVPVCTGHELTERLLQQIKPFGAGLHLGQQVTQLRPLPDGRFELYTSTHKIFHARTVFIAAGVGAFLPRSLKLPGLEAFRGTQVFEGGLSAHDLNPLPQPGSHWVVLGGDESALQQTLQRCEAGQDVTLIHRRDHFTAPPELLQALEQSRACGHLRFMAGQPVGFEARAERLTHLRIADPEGHIQQVPTDILITCLGLSPQLGPVADWGMAMARKQLTVDPAHFQTSTPGIYAVGDVNTYPGKKKLILCGFHEATLAAHHAAQSLRPGQAEPPLLYTTSSPKLHRLLGLSPRGD